MYASVSYVGTGTQTVFAIPFNYVFQTDIQAFIGGVQNNSFSFIDSTHIQFPSAPANGATVTITRATAINFPNVNFADGSTLRGGDLNVGFQQTIYGLQELNDLVSLNRQQAGQLPIVTTANNTSLLQVVSGAWTTQTLANFITGLPADSSMNLAAGAFKVALADTSLVVASGLKVQLLTNGGLSTVAGGVQVLGRDTSLTIGGLGVGVNLRTNSGLFINTGLGISLADSTLTLASGLGIGVNPASNGGLAINSGLYVRGLNLVSSDPGSPNDGDTWYNTTSFVAKQRVKGQSLTTSGFLQINGPGAAVANTTTLTAGSTFNIPANFLVPNRVLRVKAAVTYNNTGTPNLLVGLYANGSSNPLSTNFADPITTGATGVIEVEWFIHVTASGTSGTVNSLTRNCISIGGTADSVFSSVSTGLAINTTIANTMTVGLQWSVASASNTATVQISSVEVLQ